MSTQTDHMDQPTLTTMVVLYTTGVKLDTDKLVNDLPLSDKVIKIEKQGVLRRGESKKDRIRHRKVEPAVRRTTGFGHNSITLVLMSAGDGSLLSKEITVKIFQNGVFHITGVLDEKYDRDVVSYLQKHITENCLDAMVSGEWTMEARRVVLMNYKTRLVGVTNLSRETLHANIKRKGFKTNYEPAVYPAVKIYFPDTKWIAKVFRTGNVILTGMTDASEVALLVAQLRDVIA